MENDNNPLVSIIVITYNSSKYVLETLESAKDQTYKNIELIVSDDGSTDNTVEICREWINNNKVRFVRTELIDHPVNTGIPANCNRGVKASNGEWIKLIAGDDALIPNGISNFINFVHNQNHKVYLTQGKLYEDNFQNNNFRYLVPGKQHYEKVYLNLDTPEKQLEYIFKGGFYFTPGLFIKKELIIKVGYFDESHPLIEDIPFYLKLGLQKILLKFIPIVTVKYRKHNQGLTSVQYKTIPNYNRQVYIAIEKTSIQYGKFIFVINARWHKFFSDIIFLLGNKGKICFYINKFRINLQPIRFFVLKYKILNFKSNIIK